MERMARLKRRFNLMVRVSMEQVLSECPNEETTAHANRPFQRGETRMKAGHFQIDGLCTEPHDERGVRGVTRPIIEF